MRLSGTVFSISHIVRSCDSLFHFPCPVPFLCTDDHNRVILTPLAGHDDCQREYINACYIDVSVYEHYHAFNAIVSDEIDR